MSAKIGTVCLVLVWAAACRDAGGQGDLRQPLAAASIPVVEQCDDCGACASDADCDGEQGQVCVLLCPRSHCACAGGGLPDPDSGACCAVRNTNGLCCYPQELDEQGNCRCVAEGVVDVGYGCECTDRINSRMSYLTGECLCTDPNAQMGADGMCVCNTGYTPELDENSGLLVCLPPPPAIIGVVPGEACWGQTITIDGTHFVYLLTDVLVGGIPTDVKFVSSTRLTVVVPAGATLGELVVITPSGRATWSYPLAPCGGCEGVPADAGVGCPIPIERDAGVRDVASPTTR